MMFSVLACMAGFISPKQTVYAEEETLPPYNKTYTYKAPSRGFEVTLEYSSVVGLHGDMVATFSEETNEETLKKFETYCKKKIDAASIGEVFYVDYELTSAEDNDKLRGQLKYTVKLPKFYHNKEVAVIPFLDYRSPQTLQPATVDDNGCITFFGNNSSYAYAIVYNGVYKQIILIVIILVVVLVLCVLIKIYCLRKDNPEIKERKKQKAIEKKKAEHKQNKRLAQELKREKERLKRKG